MIAHARDSDWMPAPPRAPSIGIYNDDGRKWKKTSVMEAHSTSFMETKKIHIITELLALNAIRPEDFDAFHKIRSESVALQVIQGFARGHGRIKIKRLSRNSESLTVKPSM